MPDAWILSWALVVFLTWAVLGALNVGIAAISYMAFGDAATGIVRNALFGRRTKSWWGTWPWRRSRYPSATSTWALSGLWQGGGQRGGALRMAAD
jgi:hypothetical protein